MNEKKIVDDVQSLTFQLDGEVFAFDIGQIREVLEYTSLTVVRSMARFPVMDFPPSDFRVGAVLAGWKGLLRWTRPDRPSWRLDRRMPRERDGGSPRTVVGK